MKRLSAHVATYVLLFAAPVLATTAVSSASPAPARVDPVASSGAFVGSLNAVSCPAARSCTAVGNSVPGNASASETAIGEPLIEHLTGTHWSQASGHVPAQQATLGALACTSATSCEAAGYYESSQGYQFTFAEVYRGVKWASVPSSTPVGAVVNLDAMSCASASSCVVVGDSGISVSAPEFGFIESYNGTRFSTVSKSNNAGLNGVSCPTATFCVAVGNDFEVNASPIEQYNGHSWTFVPSPVPDQYVYLNGVSCTSTSFCVAVGDYGVGNQGSFIETYNGTRWAAVTHPQADSYLRAVSCTSPTFCVAVGNVGTDLDNNSPALVEEFNGHAWAETSNPSPVNGATLSAVSCSSPTFCVAVGNRAPTASESGASRGLVEEFDGRSWSVAQS